MGCHSIGCAKSPAPKGGVTCSVLTVERGKATRNTPVGRHHRAAIKLRVPERRQARSHRERRILLSIDAQHAVCISWRRVEPPVDAALGGHPLLAASAKIGKSADLLRLRVETQHTLSVVRDAVDAAVLTHRAATPLLAGSSEALTNRLGLMRANINA
eukprot:scaffold114948_cov69-Phaeocystis_antarctica.AAC.4